MKIPNFYLVLNKMVGPTLIRLSFDEGVLKDSTIYFDQFGFFIVDPQKEQHKNPFHPKEMQVHPLFKNCKTSYIRISSEDLFFLKIWRNIRVVSALSFKSR